MLKKDSVTAERNSLQSQLDTCSSQVTGLNAALTQCSIDADEALRAANQACETAKDELENQIAGQTATIVQLTASLTECNNNLASETMESDNYQGLYNDCVDDLAARDSTISGLNGDISDLNGTISGMQTEITTQTNRADNCELNLGVMTNNFTTCSDNLSNCNDEKADLNEVIQCRENNINTFTSDMNTLIDGLSTGCSASDF